MGCACGYGRVHDALQQLRRRLLMQNQGQAHHAARGAHEELAHRLVVQFVEVDLGEDHRRGGLAFEAVNRFEQHVALAVNRLPEQVVLAGEAAQRGLAEAVVGHQLRMLAAVVADDGDVVLLESRRVAVAHCFLDLGDQPGAVGIGVDGDLVGGDRRGGVDFQVAREQAAQHLHHRARAAVVARRMQGDPAGQRGRRAPVEVLHRVFQPQQPRIRTGVAEDEVAPLLGDVLAFVDDDRVEQEGGRNGQLGGALLQLLEGVGQGEVRSLAGMAHALVAQLVVGADQSATRGDAVEMVGQRTVEADVERALAGFDRRPVFGQGQLRLARAGRAGDTQAEGREVEAPRPMREAPGHAGDHVPRMAHQRADVGIELDQVAQEGMDLRGGGGFFPRGEQPLDHGG